MHQSKTWLPQAIWTLKENCLLLIAQLLHLDFYLSKDRYKIHSRAIWMQFVLPNIGKDVIYMLSTSVPVINLHMLSGNAGGGGGGKNNFFFLKKKLKKEYLCAWCCKNSKWYNRARVHLSWFSIMIFLFFLQLPTLQLPLASTIFWVGQLFENDWRSGSFVWAFVLQLNCQIIIATGTSAPPKLDNNQKITENNR